MRLNKRETAACLRNGPASQCGVGSLRNCLTLANEKEANLIQLNSVGLFSCAELWIVPLSCATTIDSIKHGYLLLAADEATSCRGSHQGCPAENADRQTKHSTLNSVIRIKFKVWLKWFQTVLTRFGRMRYITPAHGTHPGKFSHMSCALFVSTV